MGTQYLEVNEGIIAYDDAGRGPLVICVPSMGDLRSEYRFLSAQLVEAGYRVISLDVRGHGETTAHWPDYSVGAIGSDLLALIRHLNAGPAMLAGCSMAAGAAAWAAAEAPDLVTGLVLIDPFVRGSTSQLNSLLYTALFARPWGAWMWLKYFKSLYPSRQPTDFSKYCAALQANLTEPGRLEALRQMLKASKAASEERLPQVKAPALVIMGSKDPDFKNPAGEAAWVAGHLHGTCRMIEGAGHYPHAEFPEVTGPFILSFLESLKEKQNAAQTWIG